jgi:hypothetical protein
MTNVPERERQAIEVVERWLTPAVPVDEPRARAHIKAVK